MSKTILVPVDGSDHSRKAIVFAAELATQSDDRLYLLHVVQSLPSQRTLVLGAAAITVNASEEELREVGDKVLAAAKQVATENGCSNVEAEALLGDPATRIIEQAKALNANMVVMGSRGLSDLAGLLVGSVSHKVIHLAPCTCVSVR